MVDPIITVILGLVTLFTLPIAQFNNPPEIFVGALRRRGRKTSSDPSQPPIEQS